MTEVVLTGGSGFLGKIIQSTLKNKNIITVGRANASVICDLTVTIPTLQKTDLVIHSAGKAHSVPKTEEEKSNFFKVNVTGTSNLLNALERLCEKPKAFVFISSVSVYGLSHGASIGEESQLNAEDPYGLSKIQAERMITEWCKRHSVTCTILRLPLVAGPVPPGNLHSMIKAIERGYYFDIGGGKGRKSVVLAEDVAKIIPKAAAIGGTYNLTDGYHPSFSELSELIAKQLGKRKPFSIPNSLARVMARTGDLLGPKALINSDKFRKITSDLTFDNSKAKMMLGWDPVRVLDGFKIK